MLSASQHAQGDLHVGYTRDSLLNQQTFEEGTEFIEKPFTRDAILDRIARVLRT